MRLQKQTDTTIETGNCLQACVASLLGLHLSSVPNFNENDHCCILRLEKWLFKRHLALISFPAKMLHIANGFQGTFGIHGFAAVYSTRYKKRASHAVLWWIRRGVELYFDPDPDSKAHKGERLNDPVRLYLIVPQKAYEYDND